MVRLLDAARRPPGRRPSGTRPTWSSRAVGETLHTDLVAVLLVDPGRPRPLRGGQRQRLVVGCGPMAVDLRAEPGRVAAAVRRHQAVFVPDARNSDVTSPRLIGTTGLASALFIPWSGTVSASARWSQAGATRCTTSTTSSARGRGALHRGRPGARAPAGDRPPRRRGRARAAHRPRQPADVRPGPGRGGGRDAVVMIDLDGFKAVNDRYGHGLGDDVLVTMAGCLRRSCRTDDCVSRFGGGRVRGRAARRGRPAPGGCWTDCGRGRETTRSWPTPPATPPARRTGPAPPPRGGRPGPLPGKRGREELVGID